MNQIALTRILDYDGKKFVFRKYMSKHLFVKKEDEGPDSQLVEEVKNYFECDTVIQDDTGFIFMNTVPEMEILEEIQ